MHTFSRIAEAVEVKGVTWEVLTDEGAGGGCSVPWCGGEHRCIEGLGVTHVRPVATAARPDGSPLLMLLLEQHVPDDPSRFQPEAVVVFSSFTEAGDPDPESWMSVSWRTADDLWGVFLLQSGDGGQGLADALGEGLDLLRAEPDDGVPVLRYELGSAGDSDLIGAIG